MAKNGRPSQHDVARLAQVSHQTVSRVLNDREGVGPGTRRRVHEVMAALGYRPDESARALVTRRSTVIGVAVARVDLYRQARIVSSVERAARERGYTTRLRAIDDLAPRSVGAALADLLDAAVAGVVIAAPVRRSGAPTAGRVPAVSIDGDPRGAWSVLASDQRAGAALLTRHLLRLGHRTVHHVAGPATWRCSQERLDGWEQALLEAGAPVPAVVRGDWSARSGYARGRHLARDERVTAVFAANDAMALGVVRAVQDCGRGVPTDVSVAGFDDVPQAAFYGPGLTSVRQDLARLGASGVEVVLAMVAGGRGGPDEQPATLPPSLLVRRASTGPPQARRQGTTSSADDLVSRTPPTTTSRRRRRARLTVDPARATRPVDRSSTTPPTATSAHPDALGRRDAEPMTALRWTLPGAATEPVDAASDGRHEGVRQLGEHRQQRPGTPSRRSGWAARSWRPACCKGAAAWTGDT
ncbi:LacI family DNA-binding transcriptional regulator [Aquipuribacter sp. SD81]|uniref:LacI family DNA-binding transcriptional regulator n=1 Tax=Aquipuribacter sp. SD81 TaxID=3127703 RepID=UPI00301899FC